MKEFTICNFEDFHARLKSVRSMHPIYRGEDQAAYELLPKVGRLQRLNEDNVGCEIPSLQEFKRKAVPFLRHDPTGDLEWLALAQHHGLPTRLLDWTGNPLIAAYFAVAAKLDRGDAAIYVIDQYALSQATESTDPFQIKENMLYEPRYSSTRFIAQEGLFTLHCDPKSTFVDGSLQKWTIKGECRRELITSLRQFRVSRATVFPDLEGLCMELFDNWYWNVPDLKRSAARPVKAPAAIPSAPIATRPAPKKGDPAKSAK